jgi:hypothetical protein
MSDLSTILPTTELEAVNAMLDSIGEAPIDSLIDIEAPDAGTALRRLRVVSKAVQLIGWEWNTDEDMVLTPNAEGELVVPANALKLIPSAGDTRYRPTLRGPRVYDKKSQTYTFATSIKATIVTALNFDELPEAARQYIMLEAAERFQEGVLGSPTLDKFAQEAKVQAMQSLQASESEIGQHNAIYDNGDALAFFYGRS